MELENLFMFDYKVDVVLLTYEYIEKILIFFFFTLKNKSIPEISIDSNTLPNIVVIQA